MSADETSTSFDVDRLASLIAQVGGIVDPVQRAMVAHRLFGKAYGRMATDLFSLDEAAVRRAFRKAIARDADNPYSEATDCAICAMLATDRDDALAELHSTLWGEIVAERKRAHAKHGATSMESCDPMADRRLRVLTEEVGEVARVLNDREHALMQLDYAVDFAAGLRNELIQVAAMAVAWIAALDGEALA